VPPDLDDTVTQTTRGDLAGQPGDCSLLVFAVHSEIGVVARSLAGQPGNMIVFGGAAGRL